MNVSGKCVGPLVQFFKIASEDIVVIHDDLDLMPGLIRVKTGGGTGGHNGLKSIDASLGANGVDYHRIRIGIGKPVVSESGRRQPVEDYVLQPLNDTEIEVIDGVLSQVADAAELVIQNQLNEAMNRFNRRNDLK